MKSKHLSTEAKSAFLLIILSTGLSAQVGPPGVIVPGTEPVVQQQETYWISASGSVANRYVSEGVDNVPGSRFFFGEIAGGYESFTLGIWYAEAFSNAYNEINLFADYAIDLDPVEIYFGVNYLYYPSDAAPESWEAYTGIEWNPLNAITLFAETFYDFDDVKGGFIETGVVGNLPLEQISLEIQPYALLGIDYGFVSGVRRLRENNLQFGLEGDWSVTEILSFFANINHSFALRNLDNLDKGDVSWGTVGLRLDF